MSDHTTTVALGIERGEHCAPEMKLCSNLLWPLQFIEVLRVAAVRSVGVQSLVVFQKIRKL